MFVILITNTGKGEMAIRIIEPLQKIVELSESEIFAEEIVQYPVEIQEEIWLFVKELLREELEYAMQVFDIKHRDLKIKPNKLYVIEGKKK